MMASTKQISSTCGKTDDDIFIEDFARDFFGTNEPDNELSNSLPEKTPHVTQADDKKEKRMHEEVYNPKIQAAYKKKSERKVENQLRNASKNTYKDSSQIVYPNNSRQSIKRFLELRDEFLSLSDRLNDARLPNVSKKLTQALTERQKLVKALLNINDLSSSPKFDHKNEETRLHDQSRSKNLTRSTESEFGMPKNTKSVHWSDEHLGGSIILDPSLYDYQTFNSNSIQAQTPRHKGTNISKPPPRYKMVDRCTQTHSGRKKRTENEDELNRHRNIKLDLELEYVEAILNEAAELRREACGMIGRAHYLEQLCDVDGLVKHVYRSTSNLPTLPRYPHLYR